MEVAIEKFIENNNNGLFLLDSPTGFGKTYAVINILKDFLCGAKYNNIKKMFFITNLKTNLPYDELCQQLADDDIQKCLFLKAYEEDVVMNWDKADITHREIIKSEEYRNLNSDIEILNGLKREKTQMKSNGYSTSLKEMSIKSFERKISTITEPNFRKLIKRNFFEGKSRIEKEKFVRDNEWLRLLYPICELEYKKVIFMTTAKFFSPISVFYRMPFYMYNDEIIKNSVVFIDEFDATKNVVLDQIIENSLKLNVDAISLFTNIHHILQNQKFPTKLLDTVTDYNTNEDPDIEIDDEIKYYTSSQILELNTKKFEEVYNKYNLAFLLKSYDFNEYKAFIFDDGQSITVYNDKSKKFLSVNQDKNVRHLKITANTIKDADKALDKLLFEILKCLNYFTKGVKMLALNYFRKINQKDGKNNYKYSFEEALMTVITAFNLNGDNRKYIESVLTDGRFSVSNKNNFTRKGFNFTEIADSNYHDLQTITHKFSFETTPENLIALMSDKARVVGVSATASLETVIGNYDLKYIKETITNYIEITQEDSKRIRGNFEETQKIYKDVNIKVKLIDDLNCFDDNDKIKTLLPQIYNGSHLEKYLKYFADTKQPYYSLMAVKLAMLYYEINTKEIYSFIAFQNKLPKKGDDLLDSQLLDEMFSDVASCNGFEKIKWFTVSSDSFDEDMAEAYELLAAGKKCFIITTYQTVGSGKNIQYKIPDSKKDDVIIKDIFRYEKDFDGIYLMTPTNLTQILDYKSENKYKDLSKYLYQQQSLYLAKRMINNQYRVNIASGFKRIFYNARNIPYYNRNSDLCLHSAQLAIQAMGRICRCRNKNKSIYIYSDVELLSRVQYVKNSLDGRIFNSEFLCYMNTEINTKRVSGIEEYSKQNKSAFINISKISNIVRSSLTRVKEWEELRDYVLKYPTADFVDDRYQKYYFKFNIANRGYSFSKDRNYNFSELIQDTRLDKNQVSMNDCELPTMISVPCVEEYFDKNNYAKIWHPKQYIMSESLYKQIYLGALGEVVGKAILEFYTSWECQNIQDYTLYELFDFKMKNVYIDFKHWNTFQAKPDEQIKKIRQKLNKTKGEKAIIINIIKRGDHDVKISRDEDIITIPYLIDPSTNEIAQDMIERIKEEIIDLGF